VARPPGAQAGRSRGPRRRGGGGAGERTKGDRGKGDRGKVDRAKGDRGKVDRAKGERGRGCVGASWSVPIALKFAAFIAVLVVAALAWLWNTAVPIAIEQVDREITESGISTTFQVAELIDPSWLVPTDDATRDAEAIEKLKLLLRRLSARGSDSERVEDILVFSNARQGIVASANSNSSATTQRRSENAQKIQSDRAQLNGIEIEEFTVDGTRVRSFSKTLRGSGSAESPGPVGRVEVLLSAQQIESSRSELASTLRNVTIVAGVVATLAAFLLASLLTRPIRQLEKDMRQVSHGNLQHKTQVATHDELGGLARAFNMMTGSLQTAEAAKVTQKALEHELSLATQIQSGLLPDQIPEIRGLDISAFYLSAKEVGGDYYDFVPIDDRHVGVVVADVSGKGVPASLVMTMTRSLLRMASRDSASPKQTLSDVNRSLSPDISSGMFVTLAYVVIDTQTREVRLARAGHNAPLFWSARRNKLHNLHPKGIALGLDRQGPLFESQLEVQRFAMSRGDTLVLYTDGIVEGKNRRGQDFGDERLAALVVENHGRSSEEIVEVVVDELLAHEEGIERSDDITLIVIQAR